MKSISSFILLALSILVTGCNTIKIHDAPSFKFSNEDIKQGNIIFNQLKQQIGIYNDEKLHLYLERVGKRVLAGTPAKNQPFTYKVLDTSLVNANAIQGGHILITKGLLILLENESQLAAVIAHEAAHIISGHAADRERRYRETKKLSKDINNTFGTSEARQVSRLFSAISRKSYRRENELQADQLAVDYINNSQYSTSSILESLKILKNYDQYFIKNVSLNNDQIELKNILSSHPSIDKRITTIENMLKKQTRHKVNHSNPDKHYLDVINGITLGNKKSNKILTIIEIHNKKNLVKFFTELPENEKQYKNLFLLINNLKDIESLKVPSLVKWIKSEP